MLPEQMFGYDRALTVFSPDGRLLQVEYAIRAVNNGTIAVGVKTKDAVILLSDKRIVQKGLEVENRLLKIHKIDDFIGATFSGMIGDGRLLIKEAINYVHNYRLTYGTSPTIKQVAERISDIMQLYTQFAGARPFGVAIIFGGWDETGARIFLSEPSGALREYRAISIGMGSEIMNSILKDKNYEKMTWKKALKDLIDGVKEVFSKIKEDFIPDRMEVAVITKDKGFEIIKLNKVLKNGKKGSRKAGKGEEEV